MVLFIRSFSYVLCERTNGAYAHFFRTEVNTLGRDVVRGQSYPIVGVCRPIFFFSLLRAVPSEVVAFYASNRGFVRFEGAMFFCSFFLAVFFFAYATSGGGFVGP